MNLSVIGTGYVGLVSGTCFAEMGNNVICVDNNPDKLKKLQNGTVTIYEPGLEIIFERNIQKGRLTFTADLKDAVLKSEIVMLCLPTPMGENGSADLKYVRSAAKDIGAILKESGDKEFKIIVNKSTVPVGTTNEIESIVSSCGVKNFAVVSNPEFLREGFAVDDFMKPDRIVIGSNNKDALKVMKGLYEPFVRQGNPIFEMNPESSEVTKYAANSYLAMRITFMNELANFCEIVGANVDLVRKGIGSDNRIGKRFLFPGIGYGGSCFPKDVNALIKTAEGKGSPMRILDIVNQVNNNQKTILVEKYIKLFGDGAKNKKIAIWGLSFKPNTDDMREAPAIYIIKKLKELGCTINAYDPAALETAKFYIKEEVNYFENQYDALEGCDVLMILTEWNEFRNPDFQIIESKLNNKIIFDGRNIFEPERMKELGFTYFSIGR